MAKGSIIKIENTANRVYSALRLVADKDTQTDMQTACLILAEVREFIGCEDDDRKHAVRRLTEFLDGFTFN